MSLPASVCLTSKHNNKHLRFISEDTQLHGYVQSSGDEVLTPYTKFYVEVSNTGNNGSFVHLRSAYNNKYLVRSSKNHGWIKVGADEPNEDRSSWSCTMFETLQVKNDPNVIRLRHVQLGHSASVGTASKPFTSCLFAGPTKNKDGNFDDVFTVVNLEALFPLPMHITFTGDNGKFLSGQTIKDKPHLQFSSADIKDSTVWYKSINNSDGSVSLQSYHFTKFWRTGPDNWIVADLDDADTSNPDALFWPIELEKNRVVVLRDMANNFYCKRLIRDDYTDCLNAQLAEISKYAKLQVKEALASRSINEVVYQETDARIYEVFQVLLASSTTENNSDQVVDVELDTSYTNTRTSTWKSSISRKIFTGVNLDAKIPIVTDEGKIDDSITHSGPYNWGVPITVEEHVKNTSTAAVPAKNRVIINLVATQASVDIPFTYKQTDTHLDKKEFPSNYVDGFFTGTNLYGFKYETKFVPID